jgi:hypothetical protein
MEKLFSERKLMINFITENYNIMNKFSFCLFFLFFSLVTYSQEINFCKTRVDLHQRSFDHIKNENEIYITCYYGMLYKSREKELDSIDTYLSASADRMFSHVAAYEGKYIQIKNYGSTFFVYIFDPVTHNLTKILDNKSLKVSYENSDYGHCFPRELKVYKKNYFIATSAGLIIGSIDGNYEQLIDINNDGIPDVIYDIEISKEDGLLYLTSAKGLLEYNIENKKLKLINTFKCHSISLKNKEEYYITNNVNLYIYNKLNDEVTFIDSLSNEFYKIGEMDYSKEMGLWLIGSTGIYHLKSNKLIKVEKAEQSRNVHVYDNCVVYDDEKGIVTLEKCVVNSKELQINFEYYLENDIVKFKFLNELENELKIEVISSLGVNLHDSKIPINSFSFELPFSNYIPGIYFVKISDNNGKWTTKKLIKSK